MRDADRSSLELIDVDAFRLKYLWLRVLKQPYVNNARLRISSDRLRRSSHTYTDMTGVDNNVISLRDANLRFVHACIIHM